MLCLTLWCSSMTAQVLSDTTIVPTTPMTCMETDINIVGVLFALNIVQLGHTHNVSNDSIYIRVDFESPSIVLPVVGAWFDTIRLGNLPPADYHVMIETFQDSIAQDTFSFNMPVISCCPISTVSGIEDICLGDTATLVAMDSGTLNYSWMQNGMVLSTDSVLSFTPAMTGTQTIWLQAGDTSCVDSMMLTFEVNNIPAFDLGMDTNFCNIPMLTLGASSSMGDATYSWNTGDTTAAITIDSADTYVATVSVGGCSYTDSIAIGSYNFPMIDLGGNQSVCPDDSLWLNVATMGATYLWQDGSTDSTFLVDTTGTYRVTVTSAQGCATTDSATIIYTAPIAIQDSAVIFTGTTITLDIGTDSTWVSYLWSTGETTSAIEVSMIGTYCVTITDVNNCIDSACFSVGSINTTPIDQGDFIIYPSPARDYVMIQNNNSDVQISQFMLMNHLGQVLEVIQQPQPQHQLNIRHLPSGSYFIRVVDEASNRTGVWKFLKL